MVFLPWKRREVHGQPLVSLHDQMGRLFDNFWHGDLLPERFAFAEAFPKLEVTETDDELIVRAEVPGLEGKDIDVSITDQVLTIQGEKKEEKEEKEKDAWHREFRYGSFSRSIGLPNSVDTDKVDAKCKKGVLKIKLAKCESEQFRKIEIEGE